YRSDRLPALMRVWILSVTGLAVAVALYETAQVLGWRSPVSDLTVSALLVAALVAVFLFVFLGTRRPRRVDSFIPATAAEPPAG
ncbi:MAG: hypothetical protein JO036_07610, partial [Candidatus Eremiobacteraeota bacterium]|nr:hypothetical protein [Candidatus Eremiobacteraeota bacterium]